jgi:hypothetical protein
VTIRIARVALAAALALIVGGGLARAPHAEAASPSLSGTLACDVGCVDSYQVKCLQSSRTLTLLIEDIGTPDCFSVTVIGTSPVAMRGVAKAAELCGDNAVLSLVLTTPAEGPIQALATVHAVSSTASGRDYRVTASCETGSGQPRNASLVRKRDE